MYVQTMKGSQSVSPLSIHSITCNKPNFLWTIKKWKKEHTFIRSTCTIWEINWIHCDVQHFQYFTATSCNINWFDVTSSEFFLFEGIFSFHLHSTHAIFPHYIHIVALASEREPDKALFPLLLLWHYHAYVRLTLNFLLNLERDEYIQWVIWCRAKSNVFHNERSETIRTF